MLIDWFTVVAQAINFLILVVLLKVLLYDRIIRAMDERQQRIDQQLTDAREQRRTAEEEADTYRQKHRDLENQRQTLESEAREQADRTRQQLEQQAREDVDRRREQWIASLDDQREQFLTELRQRCTEQLSAIARKVLRDLADAELERQVIAAFLGRLKAADDEQLAELAAADGAITVRSAWEIPDEQRDPLRSAMGERLGTDRPIEFEQSDEVVCGVEARAGGHAVSWSVGQYLDDLAGAIDAVLRQRADDEQRREEERPAAPTKDASKKQAAESKKTDDKQPAGGTDTKDKTDADAQGPDESTAPDDASEQPAKDADDEQ